MLGALGRLLMDLNLTKTQLLVPAFSRIVHSPLRGLNKINITKPLQNKIYIRNTHRKSQIVYTLSEDLIKT